MKFSNRGTCCLIWVMCVKCSRWQNDLAGVKSTCVTWRSFCSNVKLPILEYSSRQKWQPSLARYSSTQKLCCRHPCGRYDTCLTHQRHTGQRDNTFEVFHFWQSSKSDKLRLGPTFRPSAPLPKRKSLQTLTYSCKNLTDHHLHTILVIVTNFTYLTFLP